MAVVATADLRPSEPYRLSGAAQAATVTHPWAVAAVLAAVADMADMGAAQGQPVRATTADQAAVLHTMQELVVAVAQALLGKAPTILVALFMAETAGLGFSGLMEIITQAAVVVAAIQTMLLAALVAAEMAALDITQALERPTQAAVAAEIGSLA